uniref:Collagen type V alpha 2 chain n=1 Tax=Kryptolebias marmoratus TaxID=37003 RepID=A0A3Q2ZLT9_KRYMA
MGEDGKRGPRGDGGSIGPPGPPGETGERGPPGERGETGPNGLLGPKGSPGAPGQDGPKGNPGPTGAAGEQGGPGLQGMPGERGIPGPSGETGEPGQKGEGGSPGPQGMGSVGADGPLGTPGKKGPPGVRGENGAPGRQGENGPPGPQGGPDGPPGPAGTTGQRGVVGQPGVRGERGLLGLPGPAGPPGKPGTPGAQGSKGPAGMIGLPGPTGPRGDAGTEVGPLGLDRNISSLPNKNILHADTGVRATLKTLSGHIQDLRNPDGSKMNPAKTCQDIRHCYPQKKSGEYWLDPNQGSTKDAIRVLCNMETGETCISANPADIPRKAWWTKSSPSPNKPFLYGNKEEQPNAVAVQLKLLQMLSKESHQNVTYHCKNSVAVKDKNGNLKKALVLRGANGQELRAQGNPRLRYSVIEDSCSPFYDTSTGFLTVIEYRTQTPTRLPVVDLAPLGVGMADQEFGLDIGPVCFS